MNDKIKTRNNTHFLHTPGNSREGRFFRNWRKIATVVSIITIIVVTGGIYPPAHEAQAGAIDDATVALGAEGAGVESQIVITFTPTTSIAGSDIDIYIGEDSGGDPWVDTDTSIDNTDILCEQAGGTTFGTYTQAEATVTTPSTAGCSVTGGGDASEITVTIGDGAGDDLYNPAGADIYTISVVTTDDSGAGVVYVGDANDVTVSVTVLANLSMLLDNADGTYCTGTPVIVCDLGVVLTTTTVSGNYDINVGTNGSAASVTINDNMTGQGIGTIADVTNDQTIDAGTEEYGISVSEDGAWTFQGNYAGNYTPIADAPATLATTGAAIAESGDDITVTHTAAIDSAVASGSHSHIVTYTATSTF